MSVLKLIDDIIDREGGYVNHRHDRGGPTNFGITAKTLGNFRNLRRPATSKEVQELTRNEAYAIYHDEYVRKPKFNLIHKAPLQEIVVDYGVHSGTRTATKALQTALGVTADGVIGPITLEALEDSEAYYPTLCYEVMLHRCFHLLRLIGRNPSQADFAKGWANRLEKLTQVIYSFT